MSFSFLICGGSKIASAIGKNRADIPALVKEDGLPAFKIDGKGPWHARPDDLALWCILQADKHLPPEWREKRTMNQHLISPANTGKGGG